MNIMRKSAYAAAAGLSAVVVLAGCGSSTEGTAEPTGGSAGTSAAEQAIAEDVPSGFDPCTDIPQEVLDSEGLHTTSSSSKDEMQSGKIKWKGCYWVVSDGYSTSISTTNLTLDMVREKNLPGARETTIAGRPVVIAHHSENQNNKTTCRLHAQMEGGSLEFAIDNAPSAPKTGSQYSCDIALRLAEKVVPLLPPGA
ncbi:DUF3558 domain-containing protein [Nocardia cyriacigeorgica]|uniref:DUF3558 domain-containing protein n=1 Tax=Nocardia cyriacigeorgica TaxID=135487 RepID=UPI00189441D9|nr:DUF3558 domain-containing protein [Nocardia cyriacigeorgica]MBF6343780.1 DUF3558 domain-containing protein [Nocardia cyriacigeorgica]MBF6516471.1 DUF3558 domain-containing protein [Nocardia cyriacigeorgica]